MRQLSDGVFSLEALIFNANQVIEQVCSIFAPQANVKGVGLEMSIECEKLRAPGEDVLVLENYSSLLKGLT